VYLGSSGGSLQGLFDKAEAAQRFAKAAQEARAADAAIEAGETVANSARQSIDVDPGAIKQWLRSQGEWVTGRVNRAGEPLADIFEYRFSHSASRQGMGFVEEAHHVRPKWLGGAEDSPTLLTRMGIHRGTETGLHQQLNRWLVDRGVISAEHINDAKFVRSALRSGDLTEVELKRELYHFYRTTNPAIPGVPQMLQEAFRRTVR
jgi:hypothetical protein